MLLDGLESTRRSDPLDRPLPCERRARVRVNRKLRGELIRIQATRGAVVLTPNFREQTVTVRLLSQERVYGQRCSVVLDSRGHVVGGSVAAHRDPVGDLAEASQDLAERRPARALSSAFEDPPDELDGLVHCKLCGHASPTLTGLLGHRCVVAW